MLYKWLMALLHMEIRSATVCDLKLLHVKYNLSSDILKTRIRLPAEDSAACITSQWTKY